MYRHWKTELEKEAFIFTEKSPNLEMFSNESTQRYLFNVEIKLEVERAGAQLVFWLELGELSQLGSAQLTILNLLASSAQLSSPF